VIAKKAAGRSGGGGFSDIAMYVADSEKSIHVETCNLLSLGTAYAEMDALALQNVRCEDPVYHCIVSWPEDEKPTPAQAMEAGRKVIADLGFADHQAIISYHDNTENPHIHIAINRIHPETELAHNPYNDFETMHYSCREIELQQGWSHGNGAYEIDDEGQIQKREDYDERERGLGTKERDMEAHTGEESFKTWIKEQPAKDLKTVIDKEGTWQDVHLALAKHNLELKQKGSGMVVVDKTNPDKLHAKASDIGRFATTKKLESQFGPYEPPAVIVQIETPKREYKRDTDKRLDRKQERAAERKAFTSEYYKYKQDYNRDSYKPRSNKLQELTSEKKASVEQLKAQAREDRAEIKKQAIAGNEKQVLYSCVRLRLAQQKEVIDRQTGDKRQAIREEYSKALSLKDYAQLEATKGNLVAVSVLRGLAYREQRDGKFNTNVDGIHHADKQQLPPVLKFSLANLELKVSRQGSISYVAKDTGKELFKDTGKQLVFNRNDPATIEAGLRISREKFGNSMELTGSMEFKLAALSEAQKLGITITNKELQEHIKPQYSHKKVIDREIEGPKR